MKFAFKPQLKHNKKKLMFNWVGYKEANVCIITISIGACIDNIINSEYLTKNKTIKVKRNREPFDDINYFNLVVKSGKIGCYSEDSLISYHEDNVSLRVKNLGCDIYLKSCLSYLARFVEEMKSEGYKSILSSKYEGEFKLAQACAYFENNEVSENTSMQEVYCIDNYGFENCFDVGVSYVLEKPVNVIVNGYNGISVCDKMGNKQRLKSNHFKKTCGAFYDGW